MSTTAKCKDCAHAQWTLTPSGRFKQGVAGDCMATLPPPVRMLYAQSAPPAETKPNRYRPAIWPSYEGQCDLFTKKEPTT